MRTLPLWILLCLACSGVGNDVAGLVPTYGGYEARLQALVGHTINDAVADLGAPTSTVELAAGSKLYVWDEKSEMYTPLHGTETRDQNGNEQFVMSGRERVPLDCRTELEVDAAGIVTRFRTEGIACLSAPPDRAVATTVAAPVSPVVAPAEVAPPASAAEPAAAEAPAPAAGEGAGPRRGRRVKGPRGNRE